MDDILLIFNERILFIMLGIGVFIFMIGWFLSRQDKNIGDKLGIIGGAMVFIVVIVSSMSANYNVPESWLRNLPIAEKKIQSI